MKTLRHAGRKAVSIKLVLAVCLLGMLMASPQLMAQSGADSRTCILLGMLGGPLPPHCLDGNGDNGELSDEVLAQLDQLRLATLAFYNFDVAVAAGWDTAISPCVESPMGGMGYHIANISQLTNGGHLSLMRPEVLLYAPTEDGSMEFLGVEYIIPADDWPHEHPPEFLGQHLHYNPHQDIWALHVWTARHNPNGIFDDWNPEVNCDFAPPPGE